MERYAGDSLETDIETRKALGLKIKPVATIKATEPALTEPAPTVAAPTEPAPTEQALTDKQTEKVPDMETSEENTPSQTEHTDKPS